MKLKGWIYVISNKAMPGLVKIGYSTKDPKLRAEELSSSGAPHPYIVEYEMLMEEPFKIEQKVHKALSKRREGKEWFCCTVEDAVLEIKKIAESSFIYEKPSTPQPSGKKEQHFSSVVSRPEAAKSPSGTHFKSVEGIKAKCPNCGASYSVTLRRYEIKSTCPRCRGHSPANVDWN
jgi:hypothetical protein